MENEQNTMRQRRTARRDAPPPEPAAPGEQPKRALRFGEISPTGKCALVLLALQFASEPHFRELSHRAAGGEGRAAYNPMSAMVVTELIKIALCTLILALGSARRRAAGAEGASAPASAQAGGHWRALALISSLYALQDWSGVPARRALPCAPAWRPPVRPAHPLPQPPLPALPCRCVDRASRPGSGVSPLLFQLLNQTKTVWAALLLRALVGMRRSRAQWAALAMLSASSAVLATRPAAAYLARGGLGGPSAAPPGGSEAPPAAAALLGLPPGVWATGLSALLSGANQALTEVALRAPAQPARGGAGAGGNGGARVQPASPSRPDPAVFSRQMALVKLGLALLAEGARARAAGAPAASAAARAAEAWASFWRGWRPLTVVPCALSACGGLLVGQVTALAGGDWKGYALVGGVVCSALYSHLARAEAVPPDTGLAALLVVVSMALYVRYPAAERPAKQS